MQITFTLKSDLTVGGLLMGMGVENNSHRYGMVSSKENEIGTIRLLRSKRDISRLNDSHGYS